jgi:hypothetical protein
LRILHLSDGGLPDWRIEKSAISASKLGHEVMFGGRNPTNYYNRNTFSKIYEINWTAKARLGILLYWRSVKKQFERVIKETKPDLVHAHNIFSAKMISEFDIPFVYDDHEYWSRHSQLLTEMVGKLSWRGKAKDDNNNIAVELPRKVRRLLINNYAIRLWTKWEKEVVSSHPTITVSDEIAQGLMGIGNNNNNNTKKVFVVPNFPMKGEVKDSEKPGFHNKLSSVYAGGDGYNKEKYPNRNIDGLPDTFSNHDNIGELTIIGWKEEKLSSSKIRYMGYLAREYMYNEMFKHSIGLIPFKKHWSHVFASPNKAYEYAHAGLFVMCTSSFKTVQETLKNNCSTFEGYDDMASELEYYKDNMKELYYKRLKVFEFARDNLIWEKYSENIFHAYKLCSDKTATKI